MSKEGHHNHVIKIRDELNKQGPGFCLAKWYQVTMHLHTGENHSCYHPLVHKVSLEELKDNPQALHNSKFKKQQRKTMLEGGRPNECSYCWGIEDLPGDNISDRHLRSSEPWALPLLEQTKQKDWNEDVYPTNLELSFTNKCQFRCSYCAPMASSSWFKETKKHGDWPLLSNVNRSQYNISKMSEPGNYYEDEENNPYIEAFWKWFPDCYPHLKVLRFTGGEPLISENVFKVIDYIKENPKNDLQFSVNTNMGIPRRNLDRFVKSVTELLEDKKINDVKVYTSVDTWGKQAEWIRNGLNLEQHEDNVKYFMDNTFNSKIGFMITFCLLSIPRFNLLLDHILKLRNIYNKGEQRVTFDTPYMLEPPHLTALIGDDWFMEKLDEHLEYMKSLVDDSDINKFSTLEWMKFKRVVEWIKTNRYKGEELEKNRFDFALFVEEHDRRRGTDWFEAFPEIEEFYWDCGRKPVTWK